MKFPLQQAKPDKIAHDIAVKARNQHIREAAKLRVAAEDRENDPRPGGSEPGFRKEDIVAKLIIDAELKEALAREWSEKAYRAMHPITEDQLLALLRRLSDDHIEQVMGYE